MRILERIRELSPRRRESDSDKNSTTSQDSIQDQKLKQKDSEIEGKANEEREDTIVVSTSTMNWIGPALVKGPINEKRISQISVGKRHSACVTGLTHTTNIVGRNSTR